MTAVFQGRVVQGGPVDGRALVSRMGFNALAAFSDAILDGTPGALCSDKQNAALYGKDLKDAVLCVSKCVGSTTAGPVWEYVAENGLAPQAILLAGSVDTLTAGGLVLTDIWINRPVTLIDRLGDNFLDNVAEGCRVMAGTNGRVTVEPAVAING